MIFNLGMKLNNLNKTRRFLHVEYNIYSDLVTTYLLSGHRDLFQCLRVFIIIKTEFCISFPVSDHVPLALHMPCRKCVVHFGFKWQIMGFFYHNVDQVTLIDSGSMFYGMIIERDGAAFLHPCDWDKRYTKY